MILRIHGARRRPIIPLEGSARAPLVWKLHRCVLGGAADVPQVAVFMVASFPCCRSLRHACGSSAMCRQHQPPGHAFRQGPPWCAAGTPRTSSALRSWSPAHPPSVTRMVLVALDSSSAHTPMRDVSHAGRAASAPAASCPHSRGMWSRLAPADAAARPGR